MFHASKFGHTQNLSGCSAHKELKITTVAAETKSTSSSLTIFAQTPIFTSRNPR